MMFHKKQNGHVRKKRSHLIISWTISYIVIFMIPIIIYLFFTLYTYSISTRQDKNYINNILSQKSSSIDNILTDALSCTSSLYLNSNIQKLSVLTSEKIRAKDHAYLHHTKSSINDILDVNNCFSDICIYFPKIEMAVTGKTLYSFDLIPYHSDNIITENDQLTEIQSFLTHKKGPYISLSNNNVIISQILHTNSSGDLTSFVIFKLNTKYFTERLSTDAESAYIMLVTDSKLLLHDYETPDDLLTDSQLLISKVSNIPENISAKEYISTLGKKYMLTSWSSLLPGLRYVALTSRSRYNQIYFSLISAFMITMLISIMLGIIFTVYFIRKNYAPVHKIMEHLTPLSMETKSKNEYNVILNSIINSSTELEKQKAILSNNYLQKVLFGELAYDGAFPYKNKLKLNMAGSYFYISIIRITNDTEENHELNFFIIENVLQELLISQGFHVIFCNFAHSIACIISYDIGNSDCLDNILDTHHSLHEFCLLNYGLQLHIGLSNRWQNKEDLAQAYTQAKDTLEYIHFYDCEPIYTFSAIPAMNNLTTIIIHDTNYMLDMITNIKKAEIESFFNSLTDKFKTHSITLIEGKNILYYYYQMLTQLQLFLHKRYPAINFDELDKLDNRFLHMPIMDATEMTCRIFLNVCDFIQSQKGNHQHMLISNVCHYIENNYFDENLNQTTIAHHFHMTPAYLAQKFKNEKGMTIIQYLYSVRVQHAIDLLKQNKLNISEIATAIGFPNSNSFIRVFKQFTGTTPGKYWVNHHID